MQRIPLMVIGGFLGAGKSTLLNHWLVSAGQHRLAVLINDFGEINIDAAMVAAHEGETLSLANGCICCSISSGLEQALIQVIAREPRVDMIVIEASGVSDPGRIAQVGLVDPQLQLEAVVVLVDCEHVIEQLDDALLGATLERQIRAASLVVLNKRDLVSSGRLDAVRQRLMRQFGSLPTMVTANGAIPLAQLLEASLSNEPTRQGSDPQRSVGAGACRVHRHEPQALPDHPFEGGVWRSQGVLDADALIGALKRLPRTVMRVKGWVTTDRHGRALVHLAGGRVRIDPIGPGEASTSFARSSGNELVYISIRGTGAHETIHEVLRDMNCLR